jgi:truncated hemoglobin YjbI
MPETKSLKSINSSMSIERDKNTKTPLYSKIGEQTLVTLGDALYELVTQDEMFSKLVAKSSAKMGSAMFHRFVLHITARKPYDVDKIRQGHDKLGFEDKHFNQLIKLLGKAMQKVKIKEEVAREVLQAAMATKEDFKGVEPESAVIFW